MNKPHKIKLTTTQAEILLDLVLRQIDTNGDNIATQDESKSLQIIADQLEEK